MLTVPSASLPMAQALSPFDMVAIGTSLGGIEAMSEVLGHLPASFPIPLIVVQHLSPHYRSHLAEVLDRRTPFAVEWAQCETRLQAGKVYLAPPDRHVLVKRAGVLTLSQAAKEQFSRPSVNLLFESVARCYGSRAMAVVLSGLGSDGARGVRAIKEHGGKVLVQNWNTSRAFSMPHAALKTGCVDFALSLRTIAAALVSLVMAQGASEFFFAAS
jgi:two-component system chemotaxis response regulator CheB